jgi:L-malate glycosyltransferase
MEACNQASGVRGNRLRLLQFLTSFGIGGTERQMVNLMKGLDRSRFALAVGCQRRSGELLNEALALGAPILEYPIRSFKQPATLGQVLRLARDIRRLDIHIVHSFNFYANVFAVPAARLARAPVVIASIRDIGVYQTSIQKAVHRFVCGFADRIVVNADAIRQWLLAQGVDERKICVIPNGLDMTRFNVIRRPTPIRAELGLPDDARLVILVARLNPLKGIDDFIAAAARVARVVPNASFLVVGDNWVSRRGEVVVDSAYRRQLSERLADLGLGGRVVFSGFREDVPALLAEAAVSVLPTLSEGLSNTLLESMAAGVPVVATDIGGNPEVVHHDVTGYLVPPHDPPALAAAIVRLLADRDLAERFGRAGRRRVQENFSLERMVTRTETLYRDLLGAAPRRVVRSRDVWRRHDSKLAACAGQRWDVR